MLNDFKHFFFSVKVRDFLVSFLSKVKPKKFISSEISSRESFTYRVSVWVVLLCMKRTHLDFYGGKWRPTVLLQFLRLFTVSWSRFLRVVGFWTVASGRDYLRTIAILCIVVLLRYRHCWIQRNSNYFKCFLEGRRYWVRRT